MASPEEHPPQHIEPDGARPGRGRGALALALLLLAIVGSAQVRIRTALADPNFDAKNPRRMLWSDPALLYYFTERIVENGGAAPASLRADDRFQFPDRVDALAFETVGQEYVAAWWHLFLGRGEPLHVSCLRSMAWAASLAAIGVFLLAAELSGSALVGGLAALLFALIPANYRTIGFVLIREDFALPWFALHLGLLARAARVRTRTSFVLCGLALLAALSTWHAMGFVAAIEAAALFLWFLRSGRNPFSVPGAWLAAAVVIAGSFAVPVLRAKVAALSLPMQAAIGLLAAAAWSRRRPRSRGGARLVALGAALAAGAAAWAVARALGGGIGDYSHVLRLMAAKVRWLGELPADPRALDFEARLLWQGPFETGSARGLLDELTVGLPAMLLLALLAVPAWARGRGEPRTALLAAFGAATLVVAWLVVRTTVVAALVAPVAAALLVARVPTRAAKVALVLLVLAVAGWTTKAFVERHVIGWYAMARRGGDGRVTWIANPRQHALPPLLSFLEKSVPPDEPVASDLVTSTAILAHTRRPILLQPKYESRESRRRIEEFVDVFFHRGPEDFAALLRRYECRWFVLDVKTFGIGARFLAGLRDDEPPAPGTAAALFLGDPERVPGFELKWRTPPQLAVDLFHVYELR
jgi:hypothetical protein